MMKRYDTAGRLLLIALLWLPLQVWGADQNPQLNDRFRLYIGGFFPQVESKISINGEQVAPPSISPEDVFGLEDSDSVLWGGGQWRISRRNSLEFELFELDRSGRKGFNVSDDPVEIGDYILESGELDTTFDFALGRLTYGFAVLRNERMDLSLKIGLHVADMSVAFQLSGEVCDVAQGEAPPCPTKSSPVAASEDLMAPLPHLGASFAYAFTDTVAMRLQLLGFALNLDSFDGRLLELDADISWQPWRHVGFGAGLRYFRLKFEGRSSTLDGEFEYDYLGPVLYVVTTF